MATKRGRLINGVWHCDCEPRQLAIHFKSKKGEAKNRNKWFRTCQKPREASDYCRFFLWDHAAKPREDALALKGSRSEPEWRAASAHRRAPSPQPAYTPEPGPSDRTRKRGREAVDDGDDDDEFGLNQGGSTFDKELAEVLTAVETPNKVARIDAYFTPKRRKLPWQNAGPTTGLETPQTGRRELPNPFLKKAFEPKSPFVTPSRAKDTEAELRQTTTPSSSPLDTPTPNRFRDTESDLAQAVCGLLRDAGIRLDSATEQSLGSLLSKHVRSAEGLKRGREVARNLIKAREANVTEVMHRVNTLEAELRAEREMVKHLQWKLESGYESDS